MSNMQLNGQWPTLDLCRAIAAEYKRLGSDPAISARHANVLKSISRSYTSLAHQLEQLAEIVKAERK
jgi:hypothetical protein